MERTTELKAKQWIFAMMSTLKHEDLIRCFVTLWAIWHARRKVFHENIFQSPLSTHSFVENFLNDLEMATPKSKLSQCTTSREEVAHKWTAPPSGFSKINVDAAVRKNQNCGAVAAVCRGDDGVYLGASAVVVQGISDPATLEALACREALALAADLQLQSVVIASDCLEVIQSIGRENLGRFSSVLHEIKARRQDFYSINFVHERRESNVEAHSLARSSASLAHGRHLWLVQTSYQFCIL
jgi:ribonuclease HI